MSFKVNLKEIVLNYCIVIVCITPNFQNLFKKSVVLKNSKIENILTNWTIKLNDRTFLAV